jgi:hypothetical protein
MLASKTAFTSTVAYQNGNGSTFNTKKVNGSKKKTILFGKDRFLKVTSPQSNVLPTSLSNYYSTADILKISDKGYQKQLINNECTALVKIANDLKNMKDRVKNSFLNVIFKSQLVSIIDQVSSENFTQNKTIINQMSRLFTQLLGFTSPEDFSKIRQIAKCAPEEIDQCIKQFIGNKNGQMKYLDEVTKDVLKIIIGWNAGLTPERSFSLPTHATKLSFLEIMRNLVYTRVTVDFNKSNSFRLAISRNNGSKTSECTKISGFNNSISYKKKRRQDSINLVFNNNVLYS